MTTSMHMPKPLHNAMTPHAYPLDRHLAEANGFDVRESRLPGAGQGLFAMKHFKAGDPIGTFAGHVVPEERVKRMSQEEREFVLGGFVNNKSVDATRNLNVLTRYIRDNSDQSALNAKYMRLPKEYIAVVVATRDIEPGEEIYASRAAT
mmetsp:Transcript_10917/g.28355  ORF Transcript_10917/g.28355 Transcript_10917/m.28355 type:complete len:149 (-) Transcript_10917:310-756(-)|eukprot:CAMPEP_0119409314 /NCGR_PEP_ID=MMETSP1335-20130426/2634_1 /TAXON_ID=259385 /ORGANISM="Chrysoculter rhomboideus, Strain RCC1486" /LENGTH=148 /DNA_ID=CAMNT_0007433679 /DNA_START=127 /DNA_END=573 /DNA_ORIENTATION=+